LAARAPAVQGRRARRHLDRQAHPFLRERYVEFITLADDGAALRKVTHQQVDLLLELRAPERYWVNTDSPRATSWRSCCWPPSRRGRQPVTGAAVRYVDWLFPGILGMNMMFSCLFRRRLRGAALSQERLPEAAARHASHRLRVPQRTGALAPGLILFVTAILYAGIGAVIGFHNAGNLLLLALLGVVGALSMIALGLTIAARFSSEELVGGLLNVLTWPMMLLRGSGSRSKDHRAGCMGGACLSSDHVLDAARAVMLDGAGLPQIAPNLLYLAATAFAFSRSGLVVPLAYRVGRRRAFLQRQHCHGFARRSWRRSPRHQGLAVAYGDDQWTQRLNAVLGGFFGAEVRALRSRPAPPPTP